MQNLTHFNNLDYVKALRKELFKTRSYDPKMCGVYPNSAEQRNVSLGMDLLYVLDLVIFFVEKKFQPLNFSLFSPGHRHLHP